MEKSIKRVKYTILFRVIAKVLIESEVQWKKLRKKLRNTSYENVNIFFLGLVFFSERKKEKKKLLSVDH